LGCIYFHKKDYAEARVAVEEAIALYEQNDPRPANLLSCHQCLASVYLMENGDDVKAMKYAGLALQEARKLDIPLEVSRSLLLKSEIFLYRKDYAAAEKTALEALQTDSTHLATNQTLYECIAKANIGLENVEGANLWFDRYKQSVIAYANRNFQAQISEMEVKYETEKKEMKIAVLEEEKRLMIWLGIAGGAVLLLALATFFLLWRWTVQKKRLAESQRELAEQHIKQLEQEKQLIATQAVLDGEVQERIRLARDLHDGLGSILAATRYNLTGLKNGVVLSASDVERFDAAIRLLDDSMREMRRVAHHLMPESLGRAGLKRSIADFCSTIPIVTFAYYGDESRLDPKLEVMIYRITHELTSNALKHAGASRILVEIVRDEDRIFLTVQDDGRGFDTSAHSPGIGLANIRNRVAAYNGNVDIHSVVGEGTEVNVELKIGS
jgi:signal transduction histidine kinase